MTDINFNRTNIFRSAMEAAIFGMRQGLDTFIKKGFKLKEIRITGGGANSKLWRQIAADILNLPVVMLKNKETRILVLPSKLSGCLKEGTERKPGQRK